MSLLDVNIMHIIITKYDLDHSLEFEHMNQKKEGSVVSHPFLILHILFPLVIRGYKNWNNNEIIFLSLLVNKTCG